MTTLNTIPKVKVGDFLGHFIQVPDPDKKDILVFREIVEIKDGKVLTKGERVGTRIELVGTELYPLSSVGDYAMIFFIGLILSATPPCYIFWG